MKMIAAALLALSLSTAAAADDSALDKANAKLAKGQKSAKSGAGKLERDTNESLEHARKKGKKGARKAEKDANDAARSLRRKLGTEK